MNDVPCYLYLITVVSSAIPGCDRSREVFTQLREESLAGDFNSEITVSREVKSRL